ncbi:hypothetical protein D9M68_653850 [compost metagenome]
MPAPMINVRPESGIPNLAWIVQGADKGSGIVGGFNVTDAKCIGHCLDDSWVIVLVINDVRKFLTL